MAAIRGANFELFQYPSYFPVTVSSFLTGKNPEDANEVKATVEKFLESCKQLSCQGLILQSCYYDEVSYGFSCNIRKEFYQMASTCVIHKIFCFGLGLGSDRAVQIKIRPSGVLVLVLYLGHSISKETNGYSTKTVYWILTKFSLIFQHNHIKHLCTCPIFLAVS